MAGIHGKTGFGINPTFEQKPLNMRTSSLLKPAMMGFVSNAFLPLGGLSESKQLQTRV
jgi:hypothetical protein